MPPNPMDRDDEGRPVTSSVFARSGLARQQGKVLQRLRMAKSEAHSACFNFPLPQMNLLPA